MDGIVMVDSNVYIGLLRRGIDPSECLGNWIGPGDLATCGMVRLEVERGLKVERVRRSLASFLDVMINVPTGNRVWEDTADLAWQLDRKGRVLPAQDLIIARCAFSLGAWVLTDDAHFKHIPGLECLAPATELDVW